MKDKSEALTTPPVLDELKTMLDRRERAIFAPRATFSDEGVRRQLG